MPTDGKQFRALIGGINFYRTILPDLSTSLRPINSLLRKMTTFAFTLAMEKILQEIVAYLATPPILVFLHLHAVDNGSRPFHVYCDACIDGFGAALEQDQADGP